MIQHILAVAKPNACVGSQEHTKPQAGDEVPAYGWIRHAALMCLLFEARSELKRYQFSPLLCRIGHRRVRVHASPEAAADIEAWPQSRPDSPFDAGSSFSVDRDTAETASPNPRKDSRPDGVPLDASGTAKSRPSSVHVPCCAYWGAEPAVPDHEAHTLAS